MIEIEIEIKKLEDFMWKAKISYRDQILYVRYFSSSISALSTVEEWYRQHNCMIINGKHYMPPILHFTFNLFRVHERLRHRKATMVKKTWH